MNEPLWPSPGNILQVPRYLTPDTVSGLGEPSINHNFFEHGNNYPVRSIYYNGNIFNISNPCTKGLWKAKFHPVRPGHGPKAESGLYLPHAGSWRALRGFYVTAQAARPGRKHVLKKPKNLGGSDWIYISILWGFHPRRRVAVAVGENVDFLPGPRPGPLGPRTAATK